MAQLKRLFTRIAVSRNGDNLTEMAMINHNSSSQQVKQVNQNSGAIALNSHRLSRKMPIDFARLRQISGNNQAFEVKLLNTFLQQTDIYLAEAIAACTEGNYLYLAHKMQQIKGASQNLGILLIPEITSRIETEITQNNYEAIAAAMNELQNIYQFIYQAVKEFIADLGDGLQSNSLTPSQEMKA